MTWVLQKNRQLRRSQWRIARIYRGSLAYFVCDGDGPPIAKGPGFPTKLAAMTAAASGPDAYTHATGSGTYWPGVRSIRAFRQEY
jgi:hypothetical protein